MNWNKSKDPKKKPYNNPKGNKGITFRAGISIKANNNPIPPRLPFMKCNKKIPQK